MNTKLLPTRIDFGKGNVRIAGTYGQGLRVETRLDSFDMSLVNAIVPAIGVGGSATGSLDFEQASPDAFPARRRTADDRQFHADDLGVGQRAGEHELRRQAAARRRRGARGVPPARQRHWPDAGIAEAAAARVRPRG